MILIVINSTVLLRSHQKDSNQDFRHWTNRFEERRIAIIPGLSLWFACNLIGHYVTDAYRSLQLELEAGTRAHFSRRTWRHLLSLKP
jgi:hypothetical protein